VISTRPSASSFRRSMDTSTIAITLFLLALLPFASPAFVPPASDFCQPFHTDFPPSSVSNSPTNAPFVAISPPGSYQTGSDGLELYLMKPDGTVTQKGRTNDKIAYGATVNSTFTILLAQSRPEYFIDLMISPSSHGIITFVVCAPAKPGVVTAAILIGEAQRNYPNDT